MAWISAQFRPLTIIVSLSVLVFVYPVTIARADFLDDLFGGSDTVSHVSAPPRRGEAQRYPTRPKERPSRHEVRVKSEVHFMPVARVHYRHDGQTTIAAKSDEGASSAGSKPIVAALCAPEATVAGAPAASLLAYDKTLRSGDVMMTDSGFRVFRGHSACPHDAHDFVALSSVNMARGRRNMLLAIEDATHGANGYLVMTKLNRH
jgi:hypothetical protein